MHWMTMHPTWALQKPRVRCLPQRQPHHVFFGRLFLFLITIIILIFDSATFPFARLVITLPLSLEELLQHCFFP